MNPKVPSFAGLNLALLALLIWLYGCNGGGTNPPPQDFNLTATPSSISVSPGNTSGSSMISVAPLNGFGGAVSVTINGLPAGVTSTPASPFTIAAGATVSATFSATSSTNLGDTNLTLQGSSGSLAHSAPLTLHVIPPPDFTLSVVPGSTSVVQGTTSSQITVSVGAVGAFSGETKVTLSGLPAGVSASPAPPYTISAGSSQSLTFVAGSSAPAATYPLMFNGSSGSFAHSVPFSLVVTPLTGPQPSRSSYVRTDTMPSYAVYDSAHKQLFVTVPDRNRVDVISTTDSRRIASISAPLPVGVEITPDGKEIVVGSRLEQITLIDPATLRIIERIPFQPFVTQLNGTLTVPVNGAATSNGTFLLLVGGLNSTALGLLQWNPKTGTFVDRTQETSGVGLIMRSADYSKVLVAGQDTSGGVALYDAATNKFTAHANFGGIIWALALNSNGTQGAILVNRSTLIIVDGNLNQLASFPVSFSGGTIYSPDGKFLFASEMISDLPAMTVFDTQKLAMAGRVPATPLFAQTPVESFTRPMAVDENAVVFGAEDHGVSFTDTSSPRTLPTPAPFLSAPGAVNPMQGPVGASTPVTINTFNPRNGGNVFFGTQLGLNISNDTLHASAPPSSTPGPVNVSVSFPDGWTSVAPDAFTYGPVALYIDPTGGPAAGSTPVQILGYGFNFDPSMIQVTVGGKAATVVGVDPTSLIIVPYPFPLFRLKIQTPAGTPGTADLTIATPAGSTTVSRAFQYVNQIKVVPIAGQLAQIVFDSKRRRAYISNSLMNRVEVLAVDTGTLLTPLPSGNFPTGLALTPDDSQLVISNFGDKTVTILNPDNPSTAVAVPVVDPNDTNADPRPLTIAATSADKAFVGITRNLIGCVGVLRELDLNTHAVVTRNDTNLNCLSEQILLASSPDGTQVLVGATDTSGGPVGLWFSATDRFTARSIGAFESSLAISNANGFAVDLASFDNQLHLLSAPVSINLLNDMLGVFGEKMHPSGSLLYVPTEQGMEILDTRTGTFRLRMLLPDSLPFVLDGMAIDGDGKTLVAISSTGATIVGLGAVPLSIGSLQPEQGPAAGGTPVTIHGSGFQSGATVSFDNTQVAATVVDQNTLQVVAPAGVVGPVRITITNPDGESYLLDAAFSYN